MQLDLTGLATATDETFAIGDRDKNQTESFNTFASFIAALTPTATVVDLAATGQYDSTANTFSVPRLAVLIND